MWSKRMKFVPGANMRNTSRLSPQHGITDGWQAVDIGAATIALYQEEIAKGETILWNGPMGVFEIPEFGEGTIAIAEAMAQLGATTIIGGGDSVTAVKQAGLADENDIYLHRRRRDAGIARRQRTSRRGRVNDKT